MLLARILLLGCVFSLTGCEATQMMVTGAVWQLDPKMQAQTEYFRENSVRFMLLDRMFPDPQARALAKAAARGRVVAIDRLVADGVDVDVRGTLNATPLAWAMRMRNVRGFERLLELGADPNVVFDDGNAVLHWTVRDINDKFLRLALKHGGDPNLVAGSHQETPLFHAMGPLGRHNRFILLDAGADMDFQDMFGNTPLLKAAIRSQFDIVYELLERGADYRIKSHTLGSPDLASWMAYKLTLPMIPDHELTQWRGKVVDWLEARGVEIPEFEDPLERCLRESPPPWDGCRHFVREAPTGEDRVLHDAALKGQYERVLELLQRGADHRISNPKVGEGDLVYYLSFDLARSPDTENEQTQWMNRVIEQLAARGVEIPEYLSPLDRCQRVKPPPWDDCRFFQDEAP